MRDFRYCESYCWRDAISICDVGKWSQTITGFVQVIENLESHGNSRKLLWKVIELKNSNEYEP